MPPIFHAKLIDRFTQLLCMYIIYIVESNSAVLLMFSLMFQALYSHCYRSLQQSMLRRLYSLVKSPSLPLTHLTPSPPPPHPPDNTTMSPRCHRPSRTWGESPARLRLFSPCMGREWRGLLRVSCLLGHTLQWVPS